VGFQAILADGSVIAPAVDALAVVIKSSLANERNRGVSGTCRHCQQLRDQQAIRG
jgi:hypothetical protein